MKELKFLLGLVALLMMCSCGNKGTIYFQYKETAPNGWDKDSLLVYDVTVSDTISDYDVIVNVRNDNMYAYQNLHLFIHSTSPDGAELTDTINCILADEKGRWYGRGIGSVSDLPILYMSAIRFPQEGTYRFEIKQGMRENRLKGIQEVGLKITKSSTDEQK